VTRRIVLAVLVLITLALGAVGVPLGLLTAAQVRHDFSVETKSTATTLANVAEEWLGDRADGKALRHLVAGLGKNGDLISVSDQAGAQIVGTARVPVVTAGQRGRASTVTQPAVYGHDDYILVIAPIVKDNAGNVGTVALARPTTSVDQRIALTWALIAGVSAASLLAAALVAISLARWVRRPLGALENAAQILGDGDLGVRSPAVAGPREVRTLAANFNQMAARLQALVHGHQATMADVSHQLRTPLAALRLRLELLAQDSDDATTAELAGAQEEIGRLSRLVNGMLAVASAENVTTAPVNVQVDAVITRRVAAWRPAAEEQEISLTVHDGEPVQARINDGQLEQILDNLIANALDALDAGGVVAIRASLADDRVKVIVADNGPGMTTAQKQVALRRFATNSGRGTGLGLAIVDRLAVSSGGSAMLSDTEGGGLTVTIDLPAVRPARGLRWIANSGRTGHARSASRD
jgi:signal transduction histidine kinase